MKRLVMAFMLLGSSVVVWADTAAIEFAQQAGTIGGVAQACGQDVTVFVTRVGEAIKEISADSSEETQAMAAFQTVLAKQYDSQKRSAVVPCQQAVADFSGLPILRDDYKTTVIAKLKEARVTTTQTTPPTSGITTPETSPSMPQQNTSSGITASGEPAPSSAQQQPQQGTSAAFPPVPPLENTSPSSGSTQPTAPSGGLGY